MKIILFIDEWTFFPFIDVMCLPFFFIINLFFSVLQRILVVFPLSLTLFRPLAVSSIRWTERRKTNNNNTVIMSSVGSEAGSEGSSTSRNGEIVKTGYLKKLKVTIYSLY